MGEYTATLCGDGRPGPIEERIGRRLVRLVEPGSEEGRRLLYSRRVRLVGPGGEALGRMDPMEARRILRKRLEEALDASARGSRDRSAAEEGLKRLRAWSEEVQTSDPS